MEIFETPLYDDDLIKMLGRFSLNVLALTIIVKQVYYQRSRSKDYLFTFYVINVITFFICFTMKKLELELGMALGLFAIFGVLRYRTDPIPVREMSYLFIVIGLGTINALSNRKVSWIELGCVNGIIVGLPAILESLPLLQQESREEVLYERIEMIRPENHAGLVADLEERTGLKLSRIELGKVDLLRDTVTVTVFFFPHEQRSPSVGDVEITRRVHRQ
ncbi:hypothetical protein Pla108_17010 [Botrimarina colliarenosi]|uniref:DUF4956 domain-containing protein n=1 Tax=Botrimarina colliarenosi TaxID=2528001 RepID=A0A5C6AD59_9BACT|nr:DUF4956 domain-containing protein [Botrimarina colliarenosi]TWT97549.1 hypothetical protein Pla108_17010 [Botrimarina colliarenosi]